MVKHWLTNEKIAFTGLFRIITMANLIPPLENGDRLNSIEFERRTATLPEQIKTELIDGVVYMAAALRS